MGDDETIAEQIFKGSSVTFLGQIAVGVSTFFIKIFLARGLSTADFGLLFAVINLIGFTNTFSHLGMNAASKKFVSQYVAEDEPRMVRSSVITALVIVTVASLAVSSVFILASDFLATSYFGTGEAAPVVIIISVWFFFMSYYHLLANILQGFKDFTGNTVGSVLRVFVPVLPVVILVLFFDLNVTVAAFLYLLGPVLSTVLYYVLLRRRHSEFLFNVGGGGFSRDVGRKMMIFGLPLILSGFATSVIGKIDTMMLTGLRPLGNVGLFEAAKLTKTSLGFLGGALATPIFPIVSELWTKGDRGTLRDMMNFMTKFSFLLILPAALVFLTFPEIVLRVLYGPDYIAAANTMRIFAGAAVFWSIETVFVGSLSGIGETRLVLKINGSSALFNIVANYLLIPPYGATGAAMATGLSFLLAFSLAFYYSRREIGFFPEFFPLLKAGGGSLLTLMLIFSVKKVLPLPVWPLLFVSMGSGLIFYMFWIFGTRTILEKDLVTIEENTPVPKEIVSFLRKYFFRK
ncbi:MAG: flippase [Candidatus Hadarchaeota archaeon]